MRLAFSVAALLVCALLLTGCASTPSAPPSPTDSTEDTRTGSSQDAQDIYLESVVDIPMATSRLAIELQLQRSAPSASGEASLGIVAFAKTGGRELHRTEPLVEFEAVTTTRTVTLPRGGLGPDDRPEMFSGLVLQGWTLDLPPETVEVVMTLHAGSTEELAQQGVRLPVRLEDIPVVDEVVRRHPLGVPSLF